MSEAMTAVAAVGNSRKWQRRSESAWRELVERQRRSGIDVQAFCRTEGVSRSSFERWRSILTSSDQAAPRSSSVLKGADRPVAPLRTEGGSFIDVGMIGSGVERTGEAVEIRLDLGGGVVLTIRRG